MKKNNSVLIIVSVTAMLLLVAALIISVLKLKTAKTENTQLIEQIGYEKERLEEDKRQLEGDYMSLSQELQGFSVKIDNDSILKKLDEEQKRVQLLIEELRTTKATNLRRISDLKNELTSVRKVLHYYVAQVDSLNQANTRLHSENKEVTKKYNEAAQTVESLTEEKEQLTEKVTRAAQLEARNIIVERQTGSGKKTNKINKTALLKFSFTIGKNITSQVGEKTIYIRIETPEGAVLFKKPTDTFLYENKDIVYSARKNFEYSGEETLQTLYWTVEEALWKGAYRVDIFIDGHLVGSQGFELNK
ncbi:MAG: hypothetical protein LBS50_07790 [Prevotellaceae bacterium]|jgi:uncharacterized protein (UPF0335 family)|nr:hypothetical protein [Prevotellaceae bacterium]